MFRQWRLYIIGLDPAKKVLANRIPLHAGAVQAVDHRLLLERREKALHARVVKAAMRTAHTLSYGVELGNHRPVFSTGILAALAGMQDPPLDP